MVPTNIVIFDFDDVLHGYNETISKQTNIPFQKLITFNTTDNPLLSDTEQKQLQQAYNDPEPFRHIQYYNGIEKLQKLKELDIRAYICSHCYSDEIKQLKQKSIAENIDIPSNHIYLQILNANDQKHKNIAQIAPHVQFFIDDRLDNIKTSHAAINLVPKKPWNTSNLETQKPNNPYTYKDNLNDILDHIIEYYSVM